MRFLIARYHADVLVDIATVELAAPYRSGCAKNTDLLINGSENETKEEIL